MQGPPTIFLVTPKDELTKLKFLTNGLREFVAEERIWLESGGGNSDLTNDDFTCIVKVAVLAYFLSFEDLDLLLGTPRLTVQSFDRFWTLRSLKASKLSHLANYARRVDESRYDSLGDSDADEVTRRLIGWIK
jgi:hypothetical protein